MTKLSLIGTELSLAQLTQSLTTESSFWR